ncbi:MAG: hypothetical protein HC895_24015 [Leptolyngbyaceae cyanobacterium SM1_3_5]|nr:hypothetical protein [Leptolyngbyaceae cyanobacterium SM1_3_5]
MADIIGNERDNFLQGTPAIDRIFGVGGNDTILAEASDDDVDGGSGNDLSMVAWATIR